MKKYKCDKNNKNCYLDDGSQCIPVANTITEFPYPNQGDGWVIYGTDWCPYCNRAQALLEKLDDNYIYYDIETEQIGGRSNLTQNLKKWIGTHSTIPIIFNGNKFIGGYVDLLEISEEIR